MCVLSMKWRRSLSMLRQLGPPSRRSATTLAKAEGLEAAWSGFQRVQSIRRFLPVGIQKVHIILAFWEWEAKKTVGSKLYFHHFDFEKNYTANFRLAQRLVSLGNKRPLVAVFPLRKRRKTRYGMRTTTRRIAGKSQELLLQMSVPRRVAILRAGRRWTIWLRENCSDSALLLMSTLNSQRGHG